MPNATINKISRETGISETELERLWAKAKQIATSQYNVTPADKNFWLITMGIFKKMLGCKEGEDSSCLYENFEKVILRTLLR